MEYDSLRTFRARLKEAFDYVESGSEEGDLIIHRNGTTFKLVLDSWQVAEELPTPKPLPKPTVRKPVKIATKIEPRITTETKFCKHGSPIGLCKFGCKK